MSLYCGGPTGDIVPGWSSSHYESRSKYISIKRQPPGCLFCM